MKTGLFGGAFNPVHNGHICLAQNYLNALGLDRIIFIPTFIPPHKSAYEFAPCEDRANMLKLALKGKERFEISDIEFKMKGTSYSFDTISRLKELYPEDEFYLIVGSDQFLYFENWYKADDILKMATLCTAAREQEELKRLFDFKNENENLKNAIISDFDVLEVSSSQIRDMVKNNKSIKDFVPNEVEEYIRNKGLYV